MERENKGISMLEETIMNIQKIKIFEKDDHGNKKVNAVFELSSEIGKGQITILVELKDIACQSLSKVLYETSMLEHQLLNVEIPNEFFKTTEQKSTV